MAFRISHLFTIFVLLAACFMLGDAAKSMNMPRAVQQNGAASFDQKVQALRKLAATEQGATRDLIESLDDLDDLELTQLRIPKRALASEGEVPVYGGARRSALGTYPARRGLMAYP